MGELHRLKLMILRLAWKSTVCRDVRCLVITGARALRATRLSGSSIQKGAEPGVAGAADRKLRAIR
jgi:hypothetical protein